MSGKKQGTPPSPDEQPADTHTFVVKFMRPIFQTAVFCVQATSEKSALLIASAKASKLADRHWRGRYDRRRYRYDVQHILDATMVQQDKDPEWEAETTVAELMTQFRAYKEIEYLPLKADIEFGEGQVVPQPWLKKRSDLMLADLAMDWRAQLEPVERQGIVGYRELWDERPQPQPSERRENVVPFRKPDSGEDEPEDEPA